MNIIRIEQEREISIEYEHHSDTVRIILSNTDKDGVIKKPDYLTTGKKFIETINNLKIAI